MLSRAECPLASLSEDTSDTIAFDERALQTRLLRPPHPRTSLRRAAVRRACAGSAPCPDVHRQRPSQWTRKRPVTIMPSTGGPSSTSAIDARALEDLQGARVYRVAAAACRVEARAIDHPHAHPPAPAPARRWAAGRHRHERVGAGHIRCSLPLLAVPLFAIGGLLWARARLANRQQPSAGSRCYRASRSQHDRAVLRSKPQAVAQRRADLVTADVRDEVDHSRGPDRTD